MTETLQAELEKERAKTAMLLTQLRRIKARADTCYQNTARAEFNQIWGYANIGINKAEKWDKIYTQQQRSKL